MPRTPASTPFSDSCLAGGIPDNNELLPSGPNSFAVGGARSLPDDRSLWLREVLPDPGNLFGFALVAGTFLTHVLLVSTGARHLLFENLWLDALAHVWLLLGPPLGAYLGICHLRRHGTSFLPYVTIPLGLFLSLMTGVGVGTALLAG